MWRSKSFIIASIALLASACSGQMHDQMPVASEATPTPASAGLISGLPAPSSILASLPPRNASDALLVHLGCDFELSQRVTTLGQDALLEPQWPGNGSPFDGASYALYRFNVEGYAGQQTIKLTWSGTHADGSQLWLGLSHFNFFGVGRWEWRHVPANDFIDFGPDGLLPYTNRDTGDVLLTVMLLGTAQAILGQVELGGTILGDWNMGGHDAQRTGLSPHVGPQTNHLKWALDLGGDVRANPVIAADGTIYVGTFHTDEPSDFFAVNPDGTVKWSIQTEDRVGGAAAIAPNGTLYVPTGTVSGGGGRGKLYAVNPDGTVKWTLDIGAVSTSPVLDPSGVVYATGQSGMKDSLYAVNPDSSVKWELEFTDSITTPALSANGTLFIGSRDKNLYAINADGSQQWSCALENSSTPVVSPDGTVYAKSSKLYAVNPGGIVQWTYDLGMNASAVAIGPDGTLYLANGVSGGLHVIGHDGTQKWTFPLLGWTMREKPAVGADGTVYVTCSKTVGGPWNSALLAFKSDGTLLWVYGSQEQLLSSAIGNDGTLYTGSQDDHLYAFGP